MHYQVFKFYGRDKGPYAIPVPPSKYKTAVGAGKCRIWAPWAYHSVKKLKRRLRRGPIDE